MFFAISITAQIETSPRLREVISSGGGTADIAGFGSIDFTIGEAIITTDSTTDNTAGFKDITQGFQQPESSSLIVSHEGGVVPSPCTGANRGSVTFKIIKSKGPVTIEVTGPPPATPQKVNNKTLDNLAPGEYSYIATDSILNTFDGKFTIDEKPIDCKLNEIYNGITVNGDGVNETWLIDSITNFETKTVSIFNRWGNLVWKGDNYDNTTVVWRGTNKNDDPLPDGTYFYIIVADEEVKKGWIELTH